MENSAPILELRLTGNGISPETLKAKEVAELIQSLEDALFYIVQKSNPELNKDDLFISLTEIKNESAGFGFTPNLTAIFTAGFITLSTAISTGNFNAIPIKSIDGIKTISKLTKKKNCDVEFKLNREVQAVLRPSDIIEIPSSAYIKGHTTIYAYIKRSGGEDPTVAMRVNSKDSFIYVKTTEEFAKKLGERLYETVGLTGFATWERATKKLVDFKIEQILNYKQTAIADSFSLLRERVGKYWDEIEDPKEYLMGNDE